MELLDVLAVLVELVDWDELEDELTLLALVEVLDELADLELVDGLDTVLLDLLLVELDELDFVLSELTD